MTTGVDDGHLRPITGAEREIFAAGSVFSNHSTKTLTALSPTYSQVSIRRFNAVYRYKAVSDGSETSTLLICGF